MPADMVQPHVLCAFCHQYVRVWPTEIAPGSNIYEAWSHRRPGQYKACTTDPCEGSGIAVELTPEQFEIDGEIVAGRVG